MRKFFSIYLLFFLLFPLSASAREFINVFESDITVREDASMVVTETIEIYVENNEITHGIYRDFPTKYTDAYGRKYVVDFDVLSVKRNGESEPYVIQSLTNGQRIRIGSENVVVSKGWQWYEITYETKRQLGFFEGHDELYWNVTGNGWAFPIQRVYASVSLPFGIPAEEVITDGFTGRQGSREKDFSVEVLSPQDIRFQTTETLASQEGLTVVVGWPKGFVREPSPEERREYFVRDNLSQLALVVGVVLAFLYFLSAWFLFGRDPKRGTVIPQYVPPRNLSPAEMRFIERYRFDKKAFTATIIQLAVKGAIKIEEEGKMLSKSYRLRRTKNPLQELAEDEDLVMENIFEGRDSILVGSGYRKSVANAYKEEKILLKSKMGKYFKTNLVLWIGGVVIILLAFIFSMRGAAGEGRYSILFFSFWLMFWTFGVTAIFKGLLTDIRKLRIKKLTRVASLSFRFVFAIPFLAIEVFAIIMFYRLLTSYTGHAISFLFFASAFIEIVAFYFLLRQRTHEGRKMVDEVEGFRWFLSVTEADRMNFHNPPEKTPEMFEKYLPYALALGVEHEWAEQFTDIFVDLEKKGVGYSPSWYFGSAWNAASIGSFSDSFSSSFSGAVSSASVHSGSSSGFGGGGSSGGGGGGGGGGGW